MRAAQRGRFPSYALSVIALLSLSCSGMPAAGGPASGGGGGAATGLSDQCRGDFGASKAAVRLSSFLGATARFAHSAADLETSLLDSCKSIGGALGMDAGALSGSTKTVCDAVSAKLSAELKGLRAEGNVQVNVVSTPPRCEVSMRAYADCAARCEVDVDPGKVELECEGGEISGKCSAECKGECSAQVQGVCEGRCEGSCQGGCSGVCQGACDGQCSATGANGECNGACKGTCRGSCSAGCGGSCEGQCWVRGQASCSGECRGGCSVAYEEPRCSGEIRPPKVSAECKASCDAQLHAEASCTPGHTEVTVTGGGQVDPAKLERVRAALRAGYGQMLATGEKLRRVRAAGKALSKAGQDLKGVSTVGVRAVACMSEAASLLPTALASVSASFEVQVSFTASVSASTR